MTEIIIIESTLARAALMDILISVTPLAIGIVVAFAGTRLVLKLLNRSVGK